MPVQLSKKQMLMVQKSAMVKQERKAAAIAKATVISNRQAHLREKKAMAEAKKRNAPAATTVYAHYMHRNLANFSKTSAAAPAKPKKKTMSRTSSENKKVQECDDNSDISPSEYFDDYGAHKRPARKRNPNLWAAIYAQDAANLEKEKLQVAKEQKIKEKEWTSHLEKQNAHKRKVLLNERSADISYAKARDAELQEYKRMERKKEQEVIERHKKEAAEFKLLLAQKRKKQEFEKQMKIKAELAEVARAKALLEEDRVFAEEQKLLAAEKAAAVKEENTRLLEIKRIEREKILKRELEINEEFKAKLDRQEAERTAALEKTYAVQQAKVNLALLDVKSDAEIAKEDQARARMVQEKAAAEAEAKYQEKLRKQRQANADQVAYLEIQKQNKILASKARLEEEQKQADIWSRDAKKALEEAKAKERQVRSKNYAHRKIVEDQIRADVYRKQNTNKYGMSDLEMALNTKMLRKAGVAKPGTPTLQYAGVTISRKT